MSTQISDLAKYLSNFVEKPLKHAKKFKYSSIESSRVPKYICRMDILNMPKSCEYSGIELIWVPEYFSRKGLYFNLLKVLKDRIPV